MRPEARSGIVSAAAARHPQNVKPHPNAQQRQNFEQHLNSGEAALVPPQDAMRENMEK